jgi:hypothetical protein
MEKQKYEFKKLSSGKCAFILNTPDIERTEVVSEEYARNQYQKLKDDKNKHLEELQRINKKIKDLNIEKDDELEKFIELANRANKYSEYKKAVDHREGVLSMLGLIEESIKPIEAVLPQVKRMKK